jgi:hypothetical protein
MCLRIWKLLRGRGRYIPELRVISPGSGGYASFDIINVMLFGTEASPAGSSKPGQTSGYF